MLKHALKYECVLGCANSAFHYFMAVVANRGGKR